MRRTWQYEDGILEVTGEEIVKRANSVGTKQLYVKEGWGPPGEGEAQGYIVSCTVHKRGVAQQYLQSRHGTHAVTWFFSNRLLTLPTPSLEQYRQHVVAGILVKLPAYDGQQDTKTNKTSKTTNNKKLIRAHGRLRSAIAALWPLS